MSKEPLYDFYASTDFTESCRRRHQRCGEKNLKSEHAAWPKYSSTRLKSVAINTTKKHNLNVSQWDKELNSSKKLPSTTTILRTETPFNETNLKDDLPKIKHFTENSRRRRHRTEITRNELFIQNHIYSTRSDAARLSNFLNLFIIIFISLLF